MIEQYDDPLHNGRVFVGSGFGMISVKPGLAGWAEYRGRMLPPPPAKGGARSERMCGFDGLPHEEGSLVLAADGFYYERTSAWPKDPPGARRRTGDARDHGDGAQDVPLDAAGRDVGRAAGGSGFAAAREVVAAPAASAEGVRIKPGRRVVS